VKVIFGRYVLTAPIASGGIGSLWEGLDQRLNRKIAVKLVHGFLVARAKRDVARANKTS
jgi:hypothetical protein